MLKMSFGALLLTMLMYSMPTAAAPVQEEYVAGTAAALATSPPARSTQTTANEQMQYKVKVGKYAESREVATSAQKRKLDCTTISRWQRGERDPAVMYATATTSAGTDLKFAAVRWNRKTANPYLYDASVSTDLRERIRDNAPFASVDER